MIEIWLFGQLAGTLGSALSVVLLLVALTAATYVAMTLATALRPARPALVGRDPERAARAVGLLVALGASVAALFGLRVGAAGSGGELVPSLAVAVAGAAALGSTSACALLAGARGALGLQGRRQEQQRALQAAARERTLLLEEKDRRRLAGDDLRDEVADAEVAVGRLRAALDKLEESRRGIESKVAALGPATDSPHGAEVRRTHDEIVTKLDLGRRVLGAAEASAFRLACSEPLRRLSRRRPSEATIGLEHLAGAPVAAPDALGKLGSASAAITTFLGEIGDARRALGAIVDKRPAGVVAGSEDDPWTLGQKDLDALEEAFNAVLERVDVICVRLSARATLEEVADAAGAVAASGRALGADQSELVGLAAEVTRAEAAVALATPSTSDARTLTDALGRCTAALGRSDGASLDELLKALRSIA